MNRNFFILGSVLAGLAVAIGAYGAHGGAEYLTDETSITFGKAVRYQMHHALALLAVALAFAQWPNQKKILNFAGYSLLAGIILFSGSLYIIVFANINMGYITPLGGILFVVGWFLLAYAGWKAKLKD
ncbi:MAG: DUF423 domain-containing protein [Bacteroidetes bacterium]|nr:MAG: DUF423 domain-containing protein [Bacteroidota bacterium]